jgi:recombination protein RecT
MSNALAIIEQDVFSVRDQFAMLANGDMRLFEKEAGFAIQLLTATDYAIKIAASNRQSVINAVTNVAAIGISLNPAKRQAYLVPRDGRICLDISYMGLLDLAIQSGSLLWGQAELVYESDRFELNGFDKPPTHARQPFAKDRGPIVGVYVVVKTCDGDYLTTTMTYEETMDIRDRSSAWKNGQKGPWKTDEGEMIKKTVIKRAYKLWPKTDRLDTAVHYLNNEGGEGIELHEAANDSQKSAGMTGKDICRDALASMSPEAQSYMRELAAEVDAIFRNPEAGVSMAFERVEIDQLDNDQKLALWSLLESDVRAGLKKEREDRKKAAK